MILQEEVSFYSSNFLKMDMDFGQVAELNQASSSFPFGSFLVLLPLLLQVMYIVGPSCSKIRYLSCMFRAAYLFTAAMQIQGLIMIFVLKQESGWACIILSSLPYWFFTYIFLQQSCIKFKYFRIGSIILYFVGIAITLSNTISSFDDKANRNPNKELLFEVVYWVCGTAPMITFIISGLEYIFQYPIESYAARFAFLSSICFLASFLIIVRLLESESEKLILFGSLCFAMHGSTLAYFLNFADQDEKTVSAAYKLMGIPSPVVVKLPDCDSNRRLSIKEGFSFSAERMSTCSCDDVIEEKSDIDPSNLPFTPEEEIRCSKETGDDNKITHPSCRNLARSLLLALGVMSFEIFCVSWLIMFPESKYECQANFMKENPCYECPGHPNSNWFPEAKTYDLIISQMFYQFVYISCPLVLMFNVLPYLVFSLKRDAERRFASWKENLQIDRISFLDTIYYFFRVEIIIDFHTVTALFTLIGVPTHFPDVTYLTDFIKLWHVGLDIGLASICVTWLASSCCFRKDVEFNSRAQCRNRCVLAFWIYMTVFFISWEQSTNLVEFFPYVAYLTFVIHSMGIHLLFPIGMVVALAYPESKLGKILSRYSLAAQLLTFIVHPLFGPMTYIYPIASGGLKCEPEWGNGLYVKLVVSFTLIGGTYIASRFYSKLYEREHGKGNEAKELTSVVIE